MRRSNFFSFSFWFAILVPVSLASFISTASAYSKSSPHYGGGKRVLLDSIKTLTFYEGELTQHRRTDPVPQLTCLGKVCKKFRPDVVQCSSMGDDQWKCSADLPASMRLGRVEVQCEGWDDSSDPYILKGSCGLEYTLLKAFDQTEEDNYQYIPSSNGSGFVSFMFKLVFWSILLYIIWSFVGTFFRRNPIPGANGGPGPGPGGGGNWFGGWGGPGWGSGDSSDTPPPPPYSKASSSQVPPQAQAQGSGGGIWSSIQRGLAQGAGHAAGQTAIDSLLGNRRGRNSYDWDRNNNRSGFGSGFGRPSRFGGGGGGGGWGGRSDESSSSGSGSGLRSSSGFGGTRNR